MKDIDFFSNSKYLLLPTKNNPKVYLAINNKRLKFNSFKLYNPFSKKAQILKKIAFIFPIFNIIKKEESKFIEYLNKRLNKKFISSIYIATDKDKVVLQLQENNKIFGYVKIALNEKGERKLKNEFYAIQTLQKINKIEIILSDFFDKHYFLITKNINSCIASLNSINIYKTLQLFKRNLKYSYQNHPRIKYLYKQIEIIDKTLLTYLDNIFFHRELQLVYEHGDFAPWNILSNGLVFDFEYFFENGLECLDEIKYFYQIEILLNKTSDKKIIENIFSSISCKEKKEFFILFLLKEIVTKYQESQKFSYEIKLLKKVSKI